MSRLPHGENDTYTPRHEEGAGQLLRVHLKGRQVEGISPSIYEGLRYSAMCISLPQTSSAVQRGGRDQTQREEEEREKANSFLLHALQIYTTCTHRPLKAKSRGAQQDPDATRCDDKVQCSAVQLHAVIKSRYSPAQAFYPILQHSTRVHVCYSHLLYCPAQDFIASPHVFPGRAFELHE